MAFNFAAHLQKLYPQHQYTIEPLAGGLVNFTVRATRTDHDGVAPTTSDAPATLVLKQAPPYVAVVGEEAPFSQQRQLVEAAVLGLFDAGSALEPLRGQVRVPRVVHHDTENFLLALEDLGPLATLWGIFTPSATDDLKVGPEAYIAGCVDVGRRVGIFFANVHSAECVKKVASSTCQADLELLARPTSTDLIFEAAVQPILGRLQERGGFETAVAEKLYARVVQDAKRSRYPDESCLSMGDFHPGCILVTPTEDWTAGADSHVDIGVIDWEFAALTGRGVNGDMAQFLGSIHCLLLSLRLDSLAYQGAWSFAQSLCASYASEAQLAAKLTDRSAANPIMAIFRSALILLGRETINQAVDLGWEGGGRSVRGMVKAGAWYLDRAGDDVPDMLQEANWALVLNEELPLTTALFGIK